MVGNPSVAIFSCIFKTQVMSGEAFTLGITLNRNQFKIFKRRKFNPYRFVLKLTPFLIAGKVQSDRAVTKVTEQATNSPPQNDGMLAICVIVCVK